MAARKNTALLIPELGLASARKAIRSSGDFSSRDFFQAYRRALRAPCSRTSTHSERWSWLHTLPWALLAK